MNRVECPGCGHRLKFADENAGKTAKCNKCGHSFTLPQFAPRPAAEVGGIPAAKPATRAVKPATQGSTTGPATAPEPLDQAETTAFGRILDRVAGVLIPVVAIYFFAGTLLGTAATRNTIQGDVQGNAVARDTGDTLSWVYQQAFEPANRPVRPFLPKEGRYLLFEMGNRFYYLDVAPMVAGIIVLVVLVVGFGLLGTVLQRKKRTS